MLQPMVSAAKIMMKVVRRGALEEEEEEVLLLLFSVPVLLLLLLLLLEDGLEVDVMGVMIGMDEEDELSDGDTSPEDEELSAMTVPLLLLLPPLPSAAPVEDELPSASGHLFRPAPPAGTVVPHSAATAAKSLTSALYRSFIGVRYGAVAVLLNPNPYISSAPVPVAVVG